MIARCPYCGISASAELFFEGDAARRTIAIAFDTNPQLGKLVIKYLSLFRPNKQALRWPRALTLLQQLDVDIKRGEIKRKKRNWTAPMPLWLDSLQIIIDRADQAALDLPLKDHAYLYEIISRNANKIEALAETKREQERLKRSREGASKPKKVGAVLDVEPDQEIKHVKREAGFVKDLVFNSNKTGDE